MAKKTSKAAPSASTSTAPAPSSPPAKKAKQQAEDIVTKQTTRYQETPNVATATSAPLLDPMTAAAATDGPSFGDLLADQAPSTLAPLPSTSTSSAGKPTPLSLSRLLTQALHSADSPLLNQCLSHSDPSLVAHTVRRLQPELTVPLLERLAERLALGGKGRQGGASAQRVRAVCTWLKVTLRERLAFLATIPGLVSRLEPLHRLIADRLALTAPLMGLAGRLELALAQLELRAAAEGAEAAEGEAPRYVEGESDDDSESDDEDQDEVAFEEGEVEDVGLGGESDEEEDDSEGEDYESDAGSDASAGEIGPNGFVDDEASEDDGSEAGDEDDLSDSE